MTGRESSRGAADAVAAAWRLLIEEGADVVDPAMVRAAYARPRLRELSPGVSHGIMFFSKGTGPDATRVGGYVYPRGERFWIRGPLGVGTLGEADTLEEAFALVVANLPEGCGPAVLSTADDL
ncbi:DUF6193 family natural product biosynthesis protein [Streptomyces sp. SP18CS02]|uniref:DUF6193 family natural product biosynthesis protein n=1 Tax=Streptomyces sp. SP18CS02 TaxID=3002531 RepID=UPI002E75A58C|nr:DUF6193 family natural product biosynthesis protein [Streptomyces sp. SP18CS02]MEE1756380.1 DUF6193 family natural product biosynthesis protein [Streptomyces sp. SP18CS02]